MCVCVCVCVCTHTLKPTYYDHHDHTYVRVSEFIICMLGKLTAFTRDKKFIHGKLRKSLEESLEHAVIINRCTRIVGRAPIVVAVAEAHTYNNDAREASITKKWKL